MKTFSVGSFNTRNLANPNEFFYTDEKYTLDEYNKKVAWIRNQIHHMGCNIIGFQEIFHEQALKDCLKGTQLQNGQLFIAKNETGPSVALVSNFPLTDIEVVREIPDNVITALGSYAVITQFTRPVLKANIELGPSTKIAVLVTHLKSKKPDYIDNENRHDIHIYHYGETRSLIKRAIEAAGLREIIIRLIRDNTNPLIVMGDFNESTRAVTSDIISGPDSYKNMPMEKKKSIWDVKMYDAFDILIQKTYNNSWYTHIHNGSYDILDHIYFSQEFYFRNNNRKWDIDNIKILNDHLVDETNMAVHLDKTISDHGQIAVEISEDLPKNYH